MNKFIAVLRNPNLLVVFFMGFSSGLPLVLVGGTLKAWMREAQIDLKTIGFFSIVSLPYTWKFIWSPLMDRYVLPLGRRRGWLVVSQIGLFASIFGLSTVDPASQTVLLGAWAFVVAFFSASQDIVIDAYRREILPDEQLGLGSSLYVFAYRLAMLLAGAGAFSFSKRIPWNQVYVIMAFFMAVGLLTTFFCKEPATEAPPPKTLKESVIGPLKEFFTRDSALLILAFVLLYKLGESMANDMFNPLYIDLHLDKDAVAGVSKLFGFWAMVGGGIVGGFLIVQWKLYRSLWIFGILQTAGLLAFSALAYFGHQVVAENAALFATNPHATIPTESIVTVLAIAVGVEQFTSGMATAAFVAFIASQTNKRFTATQYALLTSLMQVPRIVFGMAMGALADAVGWELYFVACTVLGIPGLITLIWIKRLLDEPEEPATLKPAAPLKTATST
jgi:PAT family beta-lactamase induction signal transducer AmpG